MSVASDGPGSTLGARGGHGRSLDPSQRCTVAAVLVDLGGSLYPRGDAAGVDECRPFFSKTPVRLVFLSGRQGRNCAFGVPGMMPYAWSRPKGV